MYKYNRMFIVLQFICNYIHKIRHWFHVEQGCRTPYIYYYLLRLTKKKTNDNMNIIIIIICIRVQVIFNTYVFLINRIHYSP